MPIYFRQDVSERLSAPVPFRPCQPDVHLFPLRLWNSARTQALRRHGAKPIWTISRSIRSDCHRFRRSLASYLQGSRVVRCDWRQVAITTGSQQALFLLSHLLLNPGDCVAMEDPGYLGARLAWQHVRRGNPSGPVDSAGMKLDSKKDFSPKLIYTTPFAAISDWQLPLHFRGALSCLTFARRKKAWVVEETMISEFRYSRAPLPSLQGLDPAERVIYIGSTSKALFPSLRIGFAVLPLPIMEKFGN